MRQREIDVVRICGLQIGNRCAGVQVLAQVDEPDAQPPVEWGAHDLAVDLRLQRGRIGGRGLQRALGIVELHLGHGVFLEQRAGSTGGDARQARLCLQ